MCRRRRNWWRAATLAVVCLGLGGVGSVHADPLLHNTNGMFDPGEWVGNPNFANGQTVASQSFPYDPKTEAGGATLYVEQGFTSTGVTAAVGTGGTPNTLFLMYDINKNPKHGGKAPTKSDFFDVFFQVPSEGNDYVAHIFGDSSASNPDFQLYEKPSSKVSKVNPDGSFDLSDTSVWTLLNPPGGPNDPDFARAKPEAAVGYNNTTPTGTAGATHVEVEFQLSINTTPQGSSNGPTGLYDPNDPAFWSGSGDVPDPPFTSGIFQLNPNGTTTVGPALAANGDPALQPQDVVPEPSTLALCAVAGMCLAGYRCRRRSGRPRG